MGLLDILNGMQNGPHGASAPGKGGMSPLTMGLLALLAYKAYQKLSPASGGNAPAPAAPSSGGLGGPVGGALGGTLAGTLGGLLQGGLGNLLNGNSGGSALNGGLNDLLDRLKQGGLADVANSWVGPGDNKPVSSSDLGSVIGDDTLNALAHQFGMSKSDIADMLSRQLPQAIDHITPDGRVPTNQEMSKML